ncbi:MAG: dihydrolipoamide acetyltransferase family protein [Armatimonadota bacterium]|nr:2-oxo acid dehydrogenase subunit E2 [bacterium]MCS7309212.1 2-oxo acid dehydrogenase subunit E2 [Armatimonadota bacterium]MDW8291316.1 dihydrolipoamide acetyltransferase family protein [Armatimonadota bacterium]
MAQVIMPKMGDGMTEGTLLRWLKKEGDVVERGEVIAEIETDKASVELPAESSGKLANILVKEGDTVPVGTVIAEILGEGEQPQAAAIAQPAVAETPVAAPPPTETVKAEEPPLQERVKASPLARRIAQEAGIDLAMVKGTGPGGRIVERDVQQFLAARQAAARLPVSEPPRPTVPPAETPTLTGGEPLSRMRRLIAERTTLTKQTVPHFYVTMDIDMTEAMALRERLNAALPEEAPKLSVNDFVTKACALALARYPQVNALYQNERIYPSSEIHIGIAVALPDGLIVPVLRHCERKTLRQIAHETRQLVEKARAGRLTPEEYSGATFSVSNLGMYGVDDFIAIINPPAVAILAVGAVQKQPVVLEDDTIAVRQRMKVTLSADHRALDGAVAAEFLRELKRILENPYQMVE